MSSGSAAVGPNTVLAQNWLPNPVNSSGADSPATRGTASRVPVTMPGRALGTVTIMVAFQAGNPKASAPSRIVEGTRRTASSVVRTTIGSMITANATDADSAENFPMGSTTSAYANTPMAMEGMPVNTSLKKRTDAAKRPRPNNAR